MNSFVQRGQRQELFPKWNPPFAYEATGIVTTPHPAVSRSSLVTSHRLLFTSASNRHIPLLEFPATRSKQRTALLSNRHTSTSLPSPPTFAAPACTERSERVAAPSCSEKPPAPGLPAVVGSKGAPRAGRFPGSFSSTCHSSLVTIHWIPNRTRLRLEIAVTRSKQTTDAISNRTFPACPPCQTQGSLLLQGSDVSCCNFMLTTRRKCRLTKHMGELIPAGRRNYAYGCICL
jgi:hypothetical protein